MSDTAMRGRMYLIALGLAAVCLGVIEAGTRVPKIRWAPRVCGLLLLVALVVITIQQMGLNLLPGAIVLAVCHQLGSTLYAAALWRREELEPNLSYWSWVWLDFAHPRDLRTLHRSLSQSPVDEVIG